MEPFSLDLCYGSNVVLLGQNHFVVDYPLRFVC